MARIPKICKEYDSKEVIEAFKELEKYFLEPSEYAYCRCEMHPMKEKGNMEFDKSKILTVVTADQAKVGSMGYFSNYIPALKGYVTEGYNKHDILRKVHLDSIYPFFNGHSYYSLFYPAQEPTYAERQAEWIKKNNVKVGTKVRVIRTFETNEEGCDICTCDEKDLFVGDETCTIDKITPDNIRVASTKQDDRWYFPYFALEVIKEPTYRPYNNDELNDLVGELLTNKQSGRKKLVTGKPTASEGVNLDGSYISAKDLLASFYRNTDKLCGVMEDN